MWISIVVAALMVLGLKDTQTCLQYLDSQINEKQRCSVFGLYSFFYTIRNPEKFWYTESAFRQIDPILLKNILFQKKWTDGIVYLCGVVYFRYSPEPLYFSHGGIFVLTG